MHVHFSKDDEGLLEILANMAGVILRNNLQNDKQLVLQNNLRNILKVMIDIKKLNLIFFFYIARSSFIFHIFLS